MPHYTTTLTTLMTGKISFHTNDHLLTDTTKD
jgi:hypothetical protein